MKILVQYTRSILVYIAVAIVILLSAYWLYFLRAPIITTPNFTYYLKPGTTVKSLADDLVSQTNLKYPTLFQILVRVRGESHKLKAGEYLFPVGSSICDVLDRVVSDKVLNHAFTIIEGSNYAKVVETLEENKIVDHTLEQMTPKEIAEKLEVPYPNMEGWLMPNTYHYTKRETDFSILRRSYLAMKKYLDQAWENRAPNLAYKTPYEALIVASMIEKEVGREDEKPIVAAVILKRLKKRMPLQIDSTVIYGLMPHFIGPLKRIDLRKRSPYNTYLHYGLPPTPIAMPSKTSIDAALHPAETNALYFVARGDGSHEFSATYQKHDRAVTKYKLQREAKKEAEEGDDE